METSNPSRTLNETQNLGIKQAARRAEAGANSLAEGTASRTPSLLFPLAALASIVASATLQSSGHRHAALFVGQWAPTFLLFGLYNKIVKVLGAD
jgi:hypothetical protein